MTLLQVEHLRTAYAAVVVNRDVSLSVDQGEIVTILGPNGAGKSTVLRAICGLLRPKRGTVHFEGQDVTGVPADRMASLGVGMVPEGRKKFPDLTVEENLRPGAYCRRNTDDTQKNGKLMESYFACRATRR